MLEFKPSDRVMAARIQLILVKDEIKDLQAEQRRLEKIISEGSA